MFIVTNSLRHTLRTPVKTTAFLLLIALSASLLTIGLDLRLEGEENLQSFEDTFRTIGTVEQIPDVMPEYSSWESERMSFSTSSGPGFDKIISASALDFEGANYVYMPKHRPYYGAYHESYVLQDQNVIIRAIIEAEPLEDCVPSSPIKLRIKRVLCGPPIDVIDNIGTGEIWFCDWAINEEPYPMHAGKTYILPIQLFPAYAFPELDSETGSACVSDYYTSNIEAYQCDENGDSIPDGLDIGPLSEWQEVTDGFYDTPQGKRWLELVKGFDRPNKTIPVVPVDATHLLMDFYNGESNVIDGRDISRQEYESGSKVCLVQQKFAELNGLKVGDSLPLPLYYADYDLEVRDAFPFNSFGNGINVLNAQGKMYPVFEDGEYLIVGIYTPGPEAGMDMVIVPTASIKQSDKNNIYRVGAMTVHNTTFEIPNGTGDQFMEEWEKTGIDHLDIRLYDKGYSQLVDGLDRMRVMSVVLLSVGGGAMILILIFFTFLFIVKNKKRTAIERSLGLSKGKSALSLFSAMMPLNVFGIALGCAVGYFLCGFIAEQAIVFGNKGAFDLTYSNWVNNSDKLEQVPIGSASFEVVAAVACTALAVSMVIISVGIWRNLRHEPLALLCTREEG